MPNYVSRDAACCECRAAPQWRALAGFLYCAAHLPAAVKESAIRVELEPALTAEEKRAADQRDLYAYVWAAMDACNSSGLIYSFPKILERIAEAEGIRGACVNDHPIVIILADKLLRGPAPKDGDLICPNCKRVLLPIAFVDRAFACATCKESFFIPESEAKKYAVNY